ncbi:protein-L-isoaspartate(D-aspartate) O-methyltransferase [uncultured Gimesia sp.]|jgi:protein-L-isoaspartate(D-aspartate) O-methyltransferase|uniref:protein-L-isoaspartate(D-aspartate) O-methyltransferase n=1 Tax=uncultured Gimesia sp. TaxID=1678688 RepID=UPI0026274F0B|nr:protein-L-isoaspartate(D-aspartate) O-methyltransferase [uncultured Gimesia sp.]
MHDSSANQDSDIWQEARERMVENQIRMRGINDLRILDAMRRVPREEFVSPDQKIFACNDCALPIDCNQTISQPYTVAYMCAAAQLTGNENVLEVGCGSGYGAAVLSLLAREVHTVERIPELVQQASERLQRLGYFNVQVYSADGNLGVPQAAPFDAIIVTAGAKSLPKPYLNQLKEGGRIIIPIGTEFTGQTMCRFTLKNGKLSEEDLGAFTFVPLIGEFGWPT